MTECLEKIRHRSRKWESEDYRTVTRRYAETRKPRKLRYLYSSFPALNPDLEEIRQHLSGELTFRFS